MSVFFDVPTWQPYLQQKYKPRSAILIAVYIFGDDPVLKLNTVQRQPSTITVQVVGRCFFLGLGDISGPGADPELVSRGSGDHVQHPSPPHHPHSSPPSLLPSPVPSRPPSLPYPSPPSFPFPSSPPFPPLPLKRGVRGSSPGKF